MNINDYIGYKLICVMSKDHENESYYDENEFELVISKDPNDETGYKAIVTGYNGKIEEWDAGTVEKRLLFEDWKIQRQVKI